MKERFWKIFVKRYLEEDACTVKIKGRMAFIRRNGVKKMLFLRRKLVKLLTSVIVNALSCTDKRKQTQFETQDSRECKQIK